MHDGDVQDTQVDKKRFPPGFWRLILAAAVIGNVGMLMLIWFSVPDWIAVSAPIFAVGIAGVIIEYRQRQTRRGEDR
ncbi:hypothetical protein L0666_08325 [Octadecabacter sp. CECT 8868]|uniref:hypothetical protein n=1 Tax=Octadecabacter algicola TaxID=2909342 RepID=UPI001F376FC3|nr:hypothetical protein [Octadecabacter algicola]MCF2904992.1 hypothetical protein [Octadecabacter algicola]